MNWMSKKDIQFNRKRKFSEMCKSQNGLSIQCDEQGNKYLSKNILKNQNEIEKNPDSFNNSGDLLKNRSVYKSLSRLFLK
jgi:hypothetical protein